MARIVRPQGRRGEVLAEILTDFPESFGSRRRFFLLREASRLSQPIGKVELENSWQHKDRIVLKFSGIDSISDAETLRGSLVAIPRSERIALTEGAIYLDDLIGITVVDIREGRRVVAGEVTDVIAGAMGAGMLEVSRGKNIALIPFVRAYLKNIDLGQGIIEMELPEGLLEINEP